MAGDVHHKGDNAAGAEHAGHAMKHSKTAHKALTMAHEKSGAAAAHAANA